MYVVVIVDSIIVHTRIHALTYTLILIHKYTHPHSHAYAHILSLNFSVARNHSYSHPLAIINAYSHTFIISQRESRMLPKQFQHAYNRVRSQLQLLALAFTQKRKKSHSRSTCTLMHNLTYSHNFHAQISQPKQRPHLTVLQA